MGFECCSVQESERRTFAVKPIAKYVDECLKFDHLPNAKSSLTFLTESNRANSGFETTTCEQVRLALLRVVVG